MRAARIGALLTLSALAWLACTVRQGTLDPSFHPEGGSGGSGASAAHGGGGQGGGLAGGGQGGTPVHCGGGMPGGDTLWEKTFAPDGAQLATGVAVDAQDNVVAVGWFDAAFTLDGVTLQMSGGLNDSQALVAKWDSGGTLTWAKQSNAGNNGVHQATAVAIDVGNNILVAGDFSGVLAFGPSCQATATGAADAFVAKFAPNGNCLWLKGVPGQGVSLGGIAAIALDKKSADPQDLWVVGSWSGNVDLGTGSKINGGSAGNAFAVKLHGSDGSYLVHQVFGESNPIGPLDKAQFGRAAASDSNGNVFVGATNAGKIQVNGVEYDASGDPHVLLAGLKEDGSFIGNSWTYHVVSKAVVPVGGMATDSAGAVLLTGAYQGAGTGFIQGSFFPDAGGSDAAYIVKLASDASVEWAIGYGNGTSRQDGISIATDSSHNILTFGDFHGSITFDVGNSLINSNVGATALYVAKLSSAGCTRWSKAFGDDGANEAWSIATDSNGDAYIAGAYKGKIQFGVSQAPESTDNKSNFFLVKLSK